MPPFRIAFTALGGEAEVVLAATEADEARALAQPAIDEVGRIEAKFSRYRPDSVVSRLAAAAGRTPVHCDEETLQLLDFADRLYGLSDGRFDVTAGVLRQAWDFRVARVPSPEQLAGCLARIGWPRVERDDALVFLPEPGMEIDFGGFGKEYAADRAAAALQAAGVRHGYVNLAGDLRVVGPRPDGQAWQIGIRHPRRPGAMVAHLALAEGALATSGDYERAFVLDGRRYCHVLDARTGWPVQHWQSVTVAAPAAVAAGTLSTLSMLMEADGLALLRDSGMPFLAIDPAGVQYRHGDAAPPA